MDVHKQPSMRVTWALAAGIPVLAGVAAWLLSDLTVSREACLTGGNGSSSEIAELAVLVLAAPLAIVWYARRARPFLAWIAVPVVASVLLALPTVFMGVQLWWSGHGCYT